MDFRGGAANSGIHTFTLTPKGASFELTDPHHFVWGVLATDVKFGVDGALYFSDWVEGWNLPGKGRIYRVHDPAHEHDHLVLETRRLLAEGMEKRSLKELAGLLAEAWNDEETSDAQIAANRVAVRRYSWDNAALMYLELFERLQERESVVAGKRS